MAKKNNFSIDFFIAHRGASALGPENTISSMILAKRYGSKWIEVDVRLSKDSEVIVFHDDNLLRLANTNQLVIEKDYKELASYDVGLWFDKSFKGETIPTLIDVIKFCNENKVNLNIEIKSDQGLAHLISCKVQKIINDYWSFKENMLISSFQLEALEKIVEGKKLKRMLLLDKFEKNDLLESNISQFSYIGLDSKKTDKPTIDFLLKKRKKILIYTVDDLVTAEKLKSWGVTAIFSNFPKDLIKSKKS